MQQIISEHPHLRVFGWARRHIGQVCLGKEDFAMQMAMEKIYPTNLAVAVCSEGNMVSWRLKDGCEEPVHNVYYETRGSQSKGMVMRQTAADPEVMLFTALNSSITAMPETSRSKRARQAVEKSSKLIDIVSQEPAVVDALVVLWMCYLLACEFTLCVCVLLALFILPAGCEASEDSSRGSASSASR
jgi:hypothetical protein